MNHEYEKGNPSFEQIEAAEKKKDEK